MRKLLKVLLLALAVTALSACDLNASRVSSDLREANEYVLGFAEQNGFLPAEDEFYRHNFDNAYYQKLSDRSFYLYKSAGLGTSWFFVSPKEKLTRKPHEIEVEIK